MAFNLKKQATSIPKMLEKDHDELGQNNTVGTTNSLLSKSRIDEDNSLIERELDKNRKEAKAETIEMQIEKQEANSELPRRTGQDEFDQLPINLLNEKRHQEYAKAYRKAQDVDAGTEFWDSVISLKDGTISQLQNDESRFKNMSESDILKNQGVRKMVMASMFDADSMIYSIYRIAADENRQLTEKENKLIDRINNEKIAILSQIQNEKQRNVPTDDLIRTRYVEKPIPDYSMDWEAVFEGWEGELDGQLIGFGATKEKAIENLKEIRYLEYGV